MSNIVRIDVSTKLKLDQLKENYSIKTFAELVEKMTSFIIDNNFDLNRNYTEDWHNVIEKSNDKTLKRIEDVIRIIRNIEKESVIPIRNQVYDMYHNNDANFKADVIDEVKKDIEVNSSTETDIEKYKIELAQIKKSRDLYFNELNNLRPLVNEILNSLSTKSGLMGSKVEATISPERLNELKQLINK